MLKQILFSYASSVFFSFILLTASSAEGRPAKKTPPKKEICLEGEGLWLKSTGEIVCRSCPSDSSYLGNEALKMPQGCLPIIWGAFLTIDTYKDISLRLAYLEELELFKNNLTPTLNSLTESTKKLIEDSDALHSKLENARLRIETMTKEAEASSRKLLIAYTVAISVTTVSLAMLILGK